MAEASKTLTKRVDAWMEYYDQDYADKPPELMTALLRDLLSEIERLSKALRIAELKASGTLANNLCPDHRDKQVGKPCLACEIQWLRTTLETIALSHHAGSAAGVARRALEWRGNFPNSLAVLGNR